jgi:hypothetical protein
MTDEIVGCPCGWKGCKSTLYKTEGRCPVCKKLLSKTVATEMGVEAKF